jgi:hypothetical protein
MNKRLSMKGKGADVFFGEPETEKTTPPPEIKKEKAVRAKPVKVTLYFPPELASRLDQVWTRRMLKDKSAQKSQVVIEALEPFLKAELDKPLDI